jgi:hypothetical protein
MEYQVNIRHYTHENFIKALSLLEWVSKCATMKGPVGTEPVFISRSKIAEIKDFVNKFKGE